MTTLLGHAPKRANRFADGQQHQVSPEKVQADDRLLVRHGEVVPVDGILSGLADLDESTLIGESLTRHRLTADAVCSGVLNVGVALEMIASASAERNTFAGVVRLISAAQSKRSPSVRPADRYAFTFGGVVVLFAGASWILMGDSVRCLAAFVVATPCPLILAVPVVVVSGLSRCVKRDVLVKGGSTLERLALVDMLFSDKTGTLISGFTRLVGVECAPYYASDVVLDLAGSIAQASNHVTTEVVAKAAREQGAKLRLPSGVAESPGAGVCGRVDGHVVSIGSSPYVLGSSVEPSWVEAFAKHVSYVGASVIFVGVNGKLVGVLQLIDHVCLEALRVPRLLCREGIKRQAMLTGDRVDVAESAGFMLGVTGVHAALSPATRFAVVRGVRADGEVIMVGDGVNDAPALAAADIGVAMGVRGAAASSEVADIVLLVDRLDRLIDVVRIAYRTRSVALQSVMIGTSLSLAAMIVVALGRLPPLAGAMLQELIDVLVIASALRALLSTPDEVTRSLVCANVECFKAEHAELEPILSRIRLVADALPHMGGNTAKGALPSFNQPLADTLAPHERRDDTQLYPDATHLLGGDDLTAAMSAMHRETFRVTNLLGRIVADVSTDDPDTAVMQELQCSLYGLDITLRLHCA